MDEEDLDDNEFAQIVNWLENIYEDKKSQKPIKQDLIILFMNNQARLLSRYV